MENNQMNQKQQAQDERKTVLNGKVVSLEQAQQMEEQVNKNQSNQTGIQEHHNNDSESVQAGEVSQNASTLQNQQSGYNIKQVNVQSGQSHFEGVQAHGQTENQKVQQQEHDAVQQSMNAKSSAKAKANTKKVD